ncbi:MAG: type II toxin-antitoxin system mRNA interferase toxin, RelE/StbE family [Anaerolineae bacterium]|nr:type II toxin-antitoxin system RelE/ParE family toxin [Anaerolineales bacterium]MCQ3972132.1 type II toxin-antitoxin system mRNA interferase toxin, RelE/StbE family [Anaerolineae bacterium]
MNEFQVILTTEAQTDIKRLDPALQTRILNRLEWIGQNAALLRHQALQGEEWSGCFKYRIGDYRLIYQIDYSAEKLIVLKVGRRREVYK